MTEQTPKHTPGPWYVHLPRDAAGGCRTIRSQDGRSQGVYRGTEIASTWGLSDDEEDKANAVLLASAPDLLKRCDTFAAQNEALREALEDCYEGIASALKVIPRQRDPDPTDNHQRLVNLVAGLLDGLDETARAALAGEPAPRGVNEELLAAVKKLMLWLPVNRPELRKRLVHLIAKADAHRGG